MVLQQYHMSKKRVCKKGARRFGRGFPDWKLHPCSLPARLAAGWLQLCAQEGSWALHLGWQVARSRLEWEGGELGSVGLRY